MNFEHEKTLATRTLAALEDGLMSTADTRALYEEADPVLVHVIFSWLRAHYRPDHPAYEGVMGRLVALCQASPAAARAAKTGESDPIVEWLEETYDYGELERTTLISLIVDKLEG